MQVLVDGDRGRIALEPDEAALAEFDERRASRDARLRVLSAHAGRPAEMPGRGPIRVLANLESTATWTRSTSRTMGRSPADGVPLSGANRVPVRGGAVPDVRALIDAMDGRPVTIRTLDIGGDKQLRTSAHPGNPAALGALEWRICAPRAHARERPAGQVRLLLPMITLDGVQAVHRVFEETRARSRAGLRGLGQHPVGVIGASTLWILDDLFSEVDFIVGTNDLVRYLLAVDRDNVVAGLLTPAPGSSGPPRDRGRPAGGEERNGLRRDRERRGHGGPSGRDGRRPEREPNGVAAPKDSRSPPPPGSRPRRRSTPSRRLARRTRSVGPRWAPGAPDEALL